jgi:uncharacterized membrane protein
MKLKNTFITGLLLWVPITITYAVVNFIFELVDKMILWIPSHYQPDQLIGFHIPGLNLLIIVLIIMLSGAIAAHYLGKKILLLGEKILSHIPLVRSIYHAVKDAANSILKPSGKSFRKVLLIEYPRKGVWSIAFLTNDDFSYLPALKKKLILAFVPTTPNPTSGFLVAVPENDCVELNLDVDQALKMVISLGTITANKTKN